MLLLSRELGRGAFGEVWEGTVEDILGPGTGIHRVAIKVHYHWTASDILS